MKTLLFAPMYIDNNDLLGSPRYDRMVKWLNYTIPLKDKIGYDQMFFIDNASSPKKIDKIQSQFPEIIVQRREKHFPRLSHLAYPYWYLAFKHGVKYAMDNNYDKAVSIDTDFFLLNNKICSYIKNLNTGWTTFYCKMYNFPEAAMQIICKDQFEKAYQFYSEDFLTYYPHGAAEIKIPFTHVEKSFNGDRWGEKEPAILQTPEMDYYGQTPLNRILIFNDN